MLKEIQEKDTFQLLQENIENWIRLFIFWVGIFLQFTPKKKMLDELYFSIQQRKFYFISYVIMSKR